MTAQPVEEQTPAPERWSTPHALAFVPSVPGPSLRVLLFLLGVQEPGGRIVITQKGIADALGLARSVVGEGLQHLQFARMVTQQQRGVYVLHPQIAAFHTPAEHDQAVMQLDPDEYLTVDDFDDRYRQTVEAHQADLQRRKTAERRDVRPPTDLDARRRQRQRQG